MKLNKAKHRILHLSHNPMQHCRLGEQWLESHPPEKDPGLSVNSWMSTSWQSAKVAKQASNTVTCTRNSVASRTRELVILLYSALVRQHLEYCV